MSKPLDYYAGYPGQQRTPKWLGVTLGSVFGGVTLIAVAIGIRMVMPAHKAEASVVPPPAPAIAAPSDVAPSIVAPPTAVAAAEGDDAVAPPAKTARHHGHAKKGHAAQVAKASPKGIKNLKHAQMYAKRVAANSNKKHGHDDIDKLLGL